MLEQAKNDNGRGAPVRKTKKYAAFGAVLALEAALCVPVGAWAGDEISAAWESTTIVSAGAQAQ